MSPNPRVINRNLHITSYLPYPEPLSKALATGYKSGFLSMGCVETFMGRRFVWLIGKTHMFPPKNPRNSNIDTKNGHVFFSRVTFSKAHHFGYPPVSFRGCSLDLFFVGVVLVEDISNCARQRWQWLTFMVFSFVLLVVFVYVHFG